MASVMARDWAMEGSTVSGSAPTSVPPVAIIISRMSTLNNAHPLIRCASFGTAGQDQGQSLDSSTAQPQEDSLKSKAEEVL